MSINSNIKLVNEILNVSNNLKETILKKEISNSKLIELEFGLNESLNILNKLDIGLMNENNMNNHNRLAYKFIIIKNNFYKYRNIIIQNTNN